MPVFYSIMKHVESEIYTYKIISCSIQFYIHTSWAFSPTCNLNYAVMMKSVFLVVFAIITFRVRYPFCMLYRYEKNNGIFRLHFYTYFADIFRRKKINEKSNFKEINPLLFALLI